MRQVLLVGLAAFSASAYALTPGSGTWVKETATYGTPNLQNAYVYVPKSTAPEVKAGKRALMLTLHGCAMTAQGNVIDGAYNWESTAEKYGMVVIAPTVPSGTTSTRSVSGCWDWFSTGWTRTNRDQVPLKKLMDAVMARTNLDIDPNQVYVSGLSSGGGEALVMGCAFPDLFAGIGSNAGPVLGAAAGDISVAVKLSASQVATNCKNANGNAYNSYFNTQVFSTVYGDGDYLVKPEHNVRNAEGWAILYGMSMGNMKTLSITGGGTAKEYTDGNGKVRISDMLVKGMGHAWPAGTDAPKKNVAYVDSARVNYPVYVTKFFFDNNLRVAGGGTTTTTTAATTTTSSTAGATTTSSTVAATTTTTAAPTTTTTTTTTTAGACFKSSNYAHVTAGRAYNSSGYAKANGSNQSLGLNNTFYTSKLRQTGPNYYVIDNTCP